MPRRRENLTRHNILLHEGDLSWLQDTYPGLGASTIVRTLIQRHRREIEERVDRATPADRLLIKRKILT